MLFLLFMFTANAESLLPDGGTTFARCSWDDLPKYICKNSEEHEVVGAKWDENCNIVDIYTINHGFSVKCMFE